MGKVFSWDEIERGEIPQPQDFETVALKIRKELEAADGVIGAILCGSILWNSCNQRSDIDCLVVYDQTRRSEVVKVLRAISQVAADIHVPTEFIPIDLHIARTPIHHIGLSFAVHLSYATKNNGLIKTNPLSLFTFDNATVVDDVRGYLRNKLRRMEKGLITLPALEATDLHRFLQKVLDTPLHVARKILWSQKVEMPDDSKRTVMHYYPDIASTQERELFTKITAADSQYSLELLAQLQNPNKNRYSEAIERVKILAWDTLEFVRESSLRFT